MTDYERKAEYAMQMAADLTVERDEALARAEQAEATLAEARSSADAWWSEYDKALKTGLAMRDGLQSIRDTMQREHDLGHIALGRYLIVVDRLLEGTAGDHRRDGAGMNEAEVRLYEIRGSLPRTEDRHWRQNFSAMVLAADLPTAVAHVQRTRPEGTEIHDALSRSGGRAVEWADR